MAKQPSNDVIFVGCDDGHDSIKLVTRSLTDKTESSKLTMPSKVVRGSRAISLIGDGAQSGVYEAGTEVFTVTDALVGSDLINTRTLNYPVSDVNRVLVHDALIRAGLSGKDVRLITGLPVQDYYRNGAPNLELIEQKKANLADKAIQPKAATPLANIISQGVACEGVAAVYDMAINDDGSDNVDFFKLLEAGRYAGVIDIGGKTIDLAVVYLDRGQPQVDLSLTRSIDFGMLRIADQIRKEIQIAHKIDEISPRAMARVMSHRTMSLYGQDQSMQNEIATAIAKVTPDLFDRIRDIWGKVMHELTTVICVGGGTYLMKDEIKNGLLSHIQSRDEPEYANARGMLKMGMRSYIQSQEQA